MTDKDQIEIPLSKRKLYLMLSGCLLFVGMGIWLVVNPPKSNHVIFGNPVFLLVTGIVAILFFGGIGVFLLRKLPDSKPGLIIHSEGITDNSSGIAAGLVLWKDIVEIVTINVENQNFILFVVRNPEEYISRQSGIFKRKAMEVNYRSYGSPISISANTLHTNFDELYQLLQSKFAAYKAKS